MRYYSISYNIAIVSVKKEGCHSIVYSLSLKYQWKYFSIKFFTPTDYLIASDKIFYQIHLFNHIFHGLFQIYYRFFR